jgi:hypothetical protein
MPLGMNLVDKKVSMGRVLPVVNLSVLVQKLNSVRNDVAKSRIIVPLINC